MFTTEYVASTICEALRSFQPGIDIQVVFENGHNFYSSRQHCLVVARIPGSIVAKQVPLKVAELWPPFLMIGAEKIESTISGVDGATIARIKMAITLDEERFNKTWKYCVEQELDRMFYTSVESVLSQNEDE